MGKKRPDAHLYADGCVIQATNHYGVGWIATDRKDRRPSEKSLRLSFSRVCSTTTEVYAAAYALLSLRQNSTVIVHSDSSAVCTAIAENEFESRIKKSNKNKPLKEAWKTLKAAVQRHTEVTAHFTRETDSTYMQKAHKAAQIGAMKPYDTEDRDIRRFQKHKKDSIEQEIELGQLTTA